MARQLCPLIMTQTVALHCGLAMSHPPYVTRPMEIYLSSESEAELQIEGCTPGEFSEFFNTAAQ